MFRIFNTSNDYTLTLLRLVVGVVYFAHGAQKVLGWFGGPGLQPTINGFTHLGVPLAFAYLAIAAEFLGGLGLIVGLLGRIAAFGIFFEMAVAVATIHWRFGLFMNWTGRQAGEGFEFHLLVLAITLVTMIDGSGAFSIDRLLTRGRRREALAREPRPIRRSA